MKDAALPQHSAIQYATRLLLRPRMLAPCRRFVLVVVRRPALFGRGKKAGVPKSADLEAGPHCTSLGVEVH